MAERQNRDILLLKNKKVEKSEFMIMSKFNMKRNIALFFLSLLGLTAQPAQAVAKEAYAVVSPDGTTLTFYFDENKSSRQGTAYELNVGKDYPKWVRLNEKSEPWNPNFKMVVFDESFKDARPVSCAYWFAEFTELTKIEGVKHIPSGIVVENTESRSQGQNRENALRILKSHLYEIELSKTKNIEWTRSSTIRHTN